MRISVSNNNQIGRVTFSRVAKPSNINLDDLSDVNTAGKQDGDILVYQANTTTYVVKALSNIDGGTF